MDDLEKFEKCRYCGKEFEEKSLLAECGECREKCHHDEGVSCNRCFDDKYDLTDCSENCGEHTVCKICAEYEGHKCQRCRQPLMQESPPAIWEIDSRTEKWRNWKLNWEGETMDMDRNPDWDFKCLECGQLHQEWCGTYGGYFVPVNSEGETIECTRLPGIKNGVCQDCGEESSHAEECRFWKARKELKEAVSQ